MLDKLWKRFGRKTEATSEAEVSGGGGAVNITAPYAGARVTKLNNHWMPEHTSSDGAIRDSWPLLTRRIRDRIRNDGILSKAKTALSRLVIGTGLDAYSDASESDLENEDYVKFEVESDTWFERWCEKEADVEGEATLWEMQATAFEDVIEAGNAIWLACQVDQPGRTIPLCYQVLEWEQIDTGQDRDAYVSHKVKGKRYNRISNGIEFDELNRKVAFYIFDAHPYDSSQGWSPMGERIPADRVIHQYSKVRPSSRLGISWFAAPLQTNQDMDRYIANELTTRGLNALLGVAIKSNDDNASHGLDAEDAETGLPKFKLGYPHIGMLKKDDEVEVVESARGMGEATSFINLLLNIHAMGAKISVNRLLGDPTRANLASIKASHSDDDAMVAPIQESIGSRVVSPIRIAHMRQAIARGIIRTVSASDYQRRQWLYNNLTIVAGSRKDLDKDDGESAIDRLRAGLSSYQDECARRGRHWRRNLQRISTANRVSAQLGVALDWTKGQGSVTGATSTDADGIRESQQQGTPNAK